jgi:hypothetical protein
MPRKTKATTTATAETALLEPGMQNPYTAADVAKEAMKPTIGRIVHHRGNDGEIRPAIVTHVWGPLCLNLFVFPKDGSDKESGIKTSVTHADPAEEPGCLNSWNWMPYQVGQQQKTEAVIAATNPEELAALRAELQALKDRQCTTEGHVHRIGSQPGVKLF